MLLQGWKHENHWVPNLDCMKDGPTLANRTFAANCCVTCSWPLVQKRIALSLKRHFSPDCLSQAFQYDGQHFASRWCHFNLFHGWVRQFPLHGWSLTDGSEMMDSFLITSNFLWTVCLLLYSVVGNWKTSFFPVCCYLLTHEVALSTDMSPQYAIQIPYAAKWHICPSEWVPQYAHCWLLLSRSSVVHFIISHFPARCKYVAPLDNLLPGNDIIAIHFQELLMDHMLTLPMPAKNM